MRRRWMAIALAGVFAVSGCTGDSDDPSSEGSTSSATATGQETGAGDPTATPSGASAAPREKADAAFGKAFAFPDGLKVTVSEPETFMPSAKSVNGGEPAFVTFEVTVENGTEANVAPAEVFVTVQSGAGEGGQVLDPDEGIKAPPTKAVAPGAKATWPLAFGVLDAEDVVVHVLPGIDAEPATFGG